MNPIRLLLAIVVCIGLSGCVSIQTSTTVPAVALDRGVQIVRSLPEDLPAKSSPFPHSQFVLLASENFVELLSPIPFVADLATNAIHQSRAEQFEARYGDVHPYRLAVAAFAGSPLVGGEGAPLTLRPFVFLQDCTDGRYRLDLVYDLTGAGWHGRYHYHLPTTYSPTEIDEPDASTVNRLNEELTRGAAILRTLIERDARGQLPASGTTADVGSLHLVGHGTSGLLSPRLILAREGQIVEESPEHLVIRLKGLPSLAASGGGLFFGVHWFAPDQLHTLKRR